MANITSSSNGNWSSTSTWSGGVVPTVGDTAVIAHNVTVDTNISIGTSPNDTSTVVLTINGSRTLTINSNITLTCLGNQSWANGAGLVMNAGAKIIFDNSSSGGSPVYRISGAGIYTLSASGSSSNKCEIKSIDGQYWQFHNGSGRYIAWSSLSANYLDFIRMGDGQCGFQIFSGSSSFSYCSFIGCREIIFVGTSTTISLIVENCTWSNGAYATASAINLQLGGTFSSGTRRFSKNVVDGALTYLSKGFDFEKNYIKGFLGISSSSYDWRKFRLNLIHSNGTENAGNGQVIISNVDRNYWIEEKSAGNPHFISARAIGSSNLTICQNIFESVGPDLADIGDCIILNPGATVGSNKILIKNNIVCRALNGESSGTMLTIYANDSSVCENERNTINVNNSSLVGSIGRRGAFAFAEASNGASGQILSLKGNLAYGTSSSQGFMGERVQGTVKDIIVPTGANYNWKFNLSDGDNLRGYEDRTSTGLLWNSGNSSAAGVDSIQGTGNPFFLDSSRGIASWATLNGFGSNFSGAVSGIKQNTSLIENLIDYVFEGFKPSLAETKAFSHDYSCVGACNWHDSSRNLTSLTSAYASISGAWL